MKKIISLVLALIILFSGLFVLTGCGDKKEDNNSKLEISESDYKNMTADDLLSRINNKSNLTTDEYIKLVSTYSYVEIKDDMTLEKNITDEALKNIESDAKPKLDTYLESLLTSEAPQVRGYGISLITSITGVSQKHLELAKNLIAKETDPYVLYKATEALSNEAKNSKEVAEFLIKMASNENAKIRVKAAYALGNSWSKGVDGALDAILKLMNDSDMDVRKAACKNSGKLEDEAVIEPLVKILNNPDEADLHGSCVDGLVTLWYDYPFFKKKSEKAYNATMDYLKKTPRTDKVPSWSAVGSFKTTSTQESFKTWKKESTYFKEDEIYNIMVDILKDPNANYLARTAAIDVVKAHCSAEKFSSLKSIVEGLTDAKANTIKSAYVSKSK